MTPVTGVRFSVQVAVASAKLAVIAGICGAGLSYAGEKRSDAGEHVYVPTIQEEKKLPDGATVLELTAKGVLTTDDKAGPFNNNQTRCAGTIVISPDGKTVVARGYCSDVAPTGDYWWSPWRNLPAEKGFQFIGGTGRFAGITGGGNFTPQATAVGSGPGIDRLTWQSETK